MQKSLKYAIPLLLILFTLLSRGMVLSEEKVPEEGAGVISQVSLSPHTQTCIGCHNIYTPGIVEDWRTSRHAKITPSEALKKPVLQKRISTDTLSEGLLGHAVGCYECHSMNPERHKDNFEHLSFSINVIVSPDDCKTCHPTEQNNFQGVKNTMPSKTFWKTLSIIL